MAEFFLRGYSTNLMFVRKIEIRGDGLKHIYDQELALIPYLERRYDIEAELVFEERITEAQYVGLRDTITYGVR
jgi:hypothetical protein